MKPLLALIALLVLSALLVLAVCFSARGLLDPDQPDEDN